MWTSGLKGCHLTVGRTSFVSLAEAVLAFLKLVLIIFNCSVSTKT